MSNIRSTMATRLAAAAALAALGTGGTLAVAAAPAGAATVSSQDAAWMQSNAQTDLAEITIGGLALDRARFATTRDLATKTRADHETAIAMLRSVASEEGVTLPTAPNSLQMAQAAQLMAVTASGFDATYDRTQIAGHETSIAQTKAEIADGTNAAVKAYAASYLPVAEMHLSMAQSAFASLTSASTATSTSATAAPTVEAGTGGMAATSAGDAAPWIALTVAGGVLLVGAGGIAGRRRLAGRSRA